MISSGVEVGLVFFVLVKICLASGWARNFVDWFCLNLSGIAFPLSFGRVLSDFGIFQIGVNPWAGVKP